MTLMEPLTHMAATTSSTINNLKWVVVGLLHTTWKSTNNNANASTKLPAAWQPVLRRWMMELLMVCSRDQRHVPSLAMLRAFAWAELSLRSGDYENHTKVASSKNSTISVSRVQLDVGATLHKLGHSFDIEVSSMPYSLDVIIRS